MVRSRCEGCSRPSTVCLCEQLPRPAMDTIITQIIILQHPHESRHKLSTVPLLSLSLSRCHVLRGRFLQPSSSPILDHLSSSSSSSSSSSIALLLFPSPSSIPIHTWLSSHLSSSCPSCPLSFSPHPPYNFPDLHPDLSSSEAVDLQPPPTHFLPLTLSSNYSSSHSHLHIPTFDAVAPIPTPASETPAAVARLPHIVLIAMDGTWQHAQEMVKASGPFLDSFAVPVCLPYDVDEAGNSIYNSDVILRKEPFKGCMTTLEAIASCLRILEPDGEAIYLKLISVLRAMVKFQACNISATHGLKGERL